jgi:acetyltransferase-like isoleucine patch superfamily enzyme
MPGAIIEYGVVVGANSIVKGVLKTNNIYAGNPIREITSS